MDGLNQQPANINPSISVGFPPIQTTPQAVVEPQQNANRRIKLIIVAMAVVTIIAMVSVGAFLLI